VTTHHEVLRQRTLAAGHEDALDAAARLLQPRCRLRPSDDDDVTGRHADDKLARQRTLQLGPKIVGQQKAGFETIEGQHQGWRLAMKLGARGQDLKMLESRVTQRSRVQVHLFKIGMSDDTPAELRPEGVDNGKITRVLIPHGTGIHSIRASRSEEGDKRGTRHLHVGNLAALGADA